MRLIGAGWGRTGTTSARAALVRLGLDPCLHMQEMFEHPEVATVFMRSLDGEPISWGEELDGWQASVDWPACMRWQQLAETWPDAVVLLTVRDPERWYDSVRGSIHQWTAPGVEIDPPDVAALLRRIWDQEFGGWEAVLDRDHAIACFERHNAEVRSLCPPDRLVEWHAEQGWEPLCAALGVPVPEEPFPHLNRRDAP